MTDGFTLPPLVEAKIASPVLRAGFIDRPRIHDALDESGATALTLVAAPAGYGKTTAVRGWCARRDAAVAWVRLDGADNDPVRLWTHIATAADRIRPGLGRPSLRRLDASNASIESAVGELTNSLKSYGDDVVLVLDELQSVTHADCISSISSAVRCLPANARLVVISRSDPALGLPQLRARGELAELRARDLAFTPAEAHELLVEREGIDLSPVEVGVLHERTEGWAAALFLAALWLRDLEDPREAVHVFGGDHRFIADYLTAEVIASLDDDGRDFLLRVCALGTFTPELCDAALGRRDSSAVLARLESSNPFVERLERGGGFRVHALFAEFARYQLAAIDPGAAASIHRRAADWYRVRGACGQAVEHAAAAGDQELVAAVLVEHYLALVRSGQARELLRWVGALDDEQIVQHPELAVSAATAATMVGHADLERRRLLQLASRAEVVCPEQVSAYVRATAEMVRAASPDGDVAHAVECGRRAVEIARSDTYADVALVASLGAHARALYLAGRVDDAWAVAMQAIEHTDVANRAPGHSFARTTLALAALDRGWHSHARIHADRAKSLVDALGANRTWLGANAAVALGCVLASEGDLAAAERELAGAEQFFRDEVFTVHHAWLQILIADVRCRRGRLALAQEKLHAASEALATFSDAGRLPLLAAEAQRAIEEARTRAGGGEAFEHPSEAEFAVLRLLTTNLSARQISAELFVSPNTVSSHMRAIYRKLGVHSRVDAVARAEHLGLLGQVESPM